MKEVEKLQEKREKRRLQQQELREKKAQVRMEFQLEELNSGQIPHILHIFAFFSPSRKWMLTCPTMKSCV